MSNELFDDVAPDDSSIDDTPLDDHELLAGEHDYGLPDADEGGSNWMLAGGAVVAVIAISFLVFDGLANETYFFDAHEVVERSDTLVGETVRVRGDVREGTVDAEAGQLDSSFDITSEGKSLTIQYQRALPDTFEEDSEIVAEGRLDDQLVLHADEVLVKCPSRYEGAPPTEGDGSQYQNVEDYDYQGDPPEAGADSDSDSDDRQAYR